MNRYAGKVKNKSNTNNNEIDYKTLYNLTEAPENENTFVKDEDEVTIFYQNKKFQLIIIGKMWFHKFIFIF